MNTLTTAEALALHDDYLRLSLLGDQLRVVEALAASALSDADRRLARIIALERELSEMRLLLASYEDGGARVDAPASLGFMYRGKRVITAMEAHGTTGLSLSTISRYCSTGYWQAMRDDSDRWLILADQDLRRKPRGSVKSRK